MESTAQASSAALPITEGITFPQRDPIVLAWTDAKEGLLRWSTWLMLAYQDIKLRYRRSLLGPFWLTLSMAITVYSMGFLYSHLFRSELATYFPFLVAGMLSWALISTTLIELTEAFVISGNLIKQIKLPYTLYIHRVITRNIIIFFHNILVIIPIIVIFHQTAKVNLHTLMLLPGLLLIYLNAFTYGLMLAIIGARFCDIVQIVKSLIQVAFFVTPIMWNPTILPVSKRYIADWNPLYSFIEMIRAPLLGASPTTFNFVMVGVITIIGFVASFMLFQKYRARIVYWL